MTTLQVVPSTVFQKLALMNASPELRDALEGLLALAIEHRDAQLRNRDLRERIDARQVRMNKYLLDEAIRWNDKIGAAEEAFALSRKSTR
jgi:hypothetical protein